MAELLRGTCALILLTLIIYCKAKPTSILKNDENTTQCPEELAENIFTEKDGDNFATYNGPDNKISDTERYVNDLETTTLCPEEQEKIKLGENGKNTLTENTPTVKDDLRSELGHNEEKKENIQSNSEPQQETTICPDEKLGRQKPTNTKSGSEHNFQETDVNEININNNYKNISEIPNKNQEEPNKRFENELETRQPDEQQSHTETAGDTTTICPEELLKQEEEQRFQNHIELNTKFDSQAQEVNVVSPEDLLPQTPKDVDATTTICPEELTVREQEDKNGNEISVKNLLKVQKDSALFKLVKDKFDAASGQHLKQKSIEPLRSKRQVSNYSPYYSSYNSQGAPISPSDSQNIANYNVDQVLKSSNQNSRQSSSSNLQNYSQKMPGNVKTYQQIQRQQQSPYYKTSQNYVKPMKAYQNPSSYPSYPNNGNLNNFFNRKSGGMRRQFQEKARPTSTVRSTRATIRKKFRPSPVFA